MTRKSQDELHGPYGGVVPELAAREHLLQLRGVIAGALAQAGAPLSALDRIAVTQGPGLVGSLLTTFSASKAMAWREGIPWVGVHHLLGHLNAARFSRPRPALPRPGPAGLRRPHPPLPGPRTGPTWSCSRRPGTTPPGKPSTRPPGC